MKITELFFRNLAFCALALFISGCASVDYVGETYAPTSRVDMYFDAKDIRRPYKVMGQMTLEEDDYVNAQKMQEDMKKEAMDRGADAVLFTGLQKIQTGVVTDWQDTTKDKGKHKYNSGTSTSHIEQKKDMTGSLLKYTDVPPTQAAVSSKKI